MLFGNILELIGKTPIIELNKIKKYYNLNFNLYAKLEYFNPFGSIKDRISYAMIKDLLDLKLINKNTTIIEATSGNTGIGLAHVCNYFNLKLIIVMSQKMSIERVELLKSLKATVILTDKSKGIELAIEKAKQLNSQIKNSYYLSQFTNIKNYQAHYKTGKEIIQDIPAIHYVVVGIGSGGSITGIGKYLKRINKNIKIIGVEPKSNPFLSKQMTGSTLLQGIGTTFIPKILDLSIVDEIFLASDSDSIRKCNTLIAQEGLFLGLSSGALLSSLIQNQSKIEKNANVCLVFADNGNKYISLKKFF